MGVHVNFAPVADVNNNPRNPVINTRSFGEDPARVGALVAAYVKGLQQGGMLATLKHFPGPRRHRNRLAPRPADHHRTRASGSSPWSCRRFEPASRRARRRRWWRTSSCRRSIPRRDRPPSAAP